ncbi:hypothetical protein [Streptomyces phaeochromogenes]|uniref:hypothetical protein n=1 Tax=Streptomyces phaeochromogenes TaxID=1923 RepID=UPI002DD92457|nr:hypothetical protein [Streptomyces phaeochromogenes]WRZ35533.1 hypothetical protein OG931_51260 [Streptomyces phaeochromogenes]WSJ02556.1 hypothetical protein OG437_02300 [Streptomyces phaeochromogenes]
MLPGDPVCLDRCVLDGVCARVQAHHMGCDVYSSDWLKAAAMLESVAEVFLNTNGHYMHYEPEEALALVMRARHKGARVQELAAQLRVWTTD